MIVLFYCILIIFFLVYKMLEVSGLLQRSMRRVVIVCPMALFFLVKKCEIEKLWISPCVWIYENGMKENLAPLKHFFLPVQSRCYKKSNDCLLFHQSLIFFCCSYIFLCCCFHRSKWFLEVAKSKRVGHHFSLTRFFIYPVITFPHFLQNFALLPAMV